MFACVCFLRNASTAIQCICCCFFSLFSIHFSFIISSVSILRACIFCVHKLNRYLLMLSFSCGDCLNNHIALFFANIYLRYGMISFPIWFFFYSVLHILFYFTLNLPLNLTMNTYAICPFSLHSHQIHSVMAKYAIMILTSSFFLYSTFFFFFVVLFCFETNENIYGKQNKFVWNME